jgi:predicted nucleic acid-binding protein
VGLIDAIGPGPVAVDTALFIYLIEEHERYLGAIRPLFEQADSGRRELVTSAVTLLEVLVVPYRSGMTALARRYETLLTRSRGVRLLDLDRVQLRTAAQLRARHAGLRTPDALQLAAGLTARCGVLVTNDRRYPENAGIRIVQLSEHL